jgi:hypothetical protein
MATDKPIGSENGPAESEDRNIIGTNRQEEAWEASARSRAARPVEADDEPRWQQHWWCNVAPAPSPRASRLPARASRFAAR